MTRRPPLSSAMWSLLAAALVATGCTVGVVGTGERPPIDPDPVVDGGRGGPAGDPRDGGPGADDDDDMDALDGGRPADDGGPPPPTEDFVEVGGIVAFEAEHWHEQTGSEELAVAWYTVSTEARYPDVGCVTEVVCSGATRPDCNEYPECDGDDTDPAEAAGGAYVEALPDRRRDDHEEGTGNIGVVNTPGRGPTLHYRVWFGRTGRYYVWGRARGQGPAANGLHIGLDGEWPRNDLVDPSTMRMQFPGGWRWTQNRRGGRQHTGVSATDDVSRRDANIWLEVPTPGMHVVQLSMREDGLELDKLVLAIDPAFEPSGEGPAETRGD